MKYVKLIHKWISLIVGIQLLLWIVSGLYFNLMDHDKAAGHTYRDHTMHVQDAEIDIRRLIEPQDVLADAKASQSLGLVQLLGQPYYLLTHHAGLYSHLKASHSLLNAYTGELTIIDKLMAEELAAQSYTGPGKAVSVAQLRPPVEDFPKQQNPLWQITYDDEVNTSVYLDAATGRIIGHSDDDKRLAGLFFMLHFMDYGNEGSFNNTLIIFFAIATLWLALSGVIWAVELVANGQYRLSLSNKSNKVKVVNEGSQPRILQLSQQENLLDSLLEHQIALPSSCGGGGTCGQCQVKLTATNTCKVRVTSAEIEHFSQQQLNAGYRLACQHNSNEIDTIGGFNATSAKKQTLTLISSEFISPFIKELRFKVSDGSRLIFKAGAYMRFFIPAASSRAIPSDLPVHHQQHWHHVADIEYQHESCSRSYSLANYDSQCDELVFTVKIQGTPTNSSVKPGIGSGYICNLVAGETIDAVGPFEDFGPSGLSDKTRVLIGAGAGMAPLKSIIYEQLEKHNSDDIIHFYFGARNEEDQIYAAEFCALSEKFSNFNYVPVLSRPNENWSDASGYAQHIMARDLAAIGLLDNIEFYLCGPQQMMVDTISLLKAIGVKDHAIAFDDFSN